MPVPVTAAPESGFSPQYLAVVQRYAAGDRGTAVAEITAWPDSRLKNETKVAAKLGTAAQRCSEAAPAERHTECSAAFLGGSWTSAALMLHTDAALGARETGRFLPLQESAALRLAGLVKYQPTGRLFVGTWFLAVAASVERRADWSGALWWAERGLHEIPETLDLYLVIASVEEILASLVPVRLPPSAFSDPDSRRLREQLSDSKDRRQHLERAQRAVLEVLREQPDRLDARLRLGRIAWQLGRAAEAHVSFEAVLAARPAPREAYLAHLFLGRLLEDEGRLQDAGRAYGAAIALDQRCQSARVALSHIYLQLGDAPSARRELATALGYAGRRKAPDQFWAYPWGPSIRSDALLAALRHRLSS
jgi:tetratricopeptide (TPR) repeat protein